MSFRFTLMALATLLAVALLAGCAGNAAPEVAEAPAAEANVIKQIKDAGVIRIAVPEDTPLFGIVGADGTHEGYDVDVARLLAEDMGVELELVPVTSANRIPYLTSGKVDLVISSMGIKPERAEVINFSNAYAPFFWAVFAPADIDVTSVEDAFAYTVGAPMGTLEEIAYSDAAGADATNIQRFDDQATTVQAFLTGQVDLIVTGNAIAAGIIADHPEMNVETKFVLQQSPCHVGVRRGDDGLLTWVNAFIYSHTLNGDLDQFSTKWFGEPLPDFPNY
ncbi:MAG: transporter substrate-binding domain-containing protein [Anaerolineales bacterium]|nr:transporter substrate-binding domain-containing protein [Anaerolineales bacterium]